MRKGVSEEDFSQEIEDSLAVLRGICRDHKRGVLTEEECFRRFSEEVDRGFSEYLDSKGICTEFRDDTWSRFLADYKLWKDGEDPKSGTGGAWLRHHDSLEAGVREKVGFFRCMDAYDLPASWFAPVPDGCIRPKSRFDMYGTGLAGTVRFDLTDDGGLFICDNPAGKAFVLTDETGLTAHIIIERPGREEEVHNRFSPAYAGRGTIEGYTSSRAREILISEKSGDAVWFWISCGEDDLDAQSHFPLWEPFRFHEAERNRIRRETIERCISSLEAAL